jgi:hypothetical protein
MRLSTAALCPFPNRPVPHRRRVPVSVTCTTGSLAVHLSPIAIARAADPAHGRWGARVMAPQVFPNRAKSTHECGRCWWGSRRGSPAVPTLMARIDWPHLPLSYVAYVCFKYFRCFRLMLELFHLDVAKVDQRCCKCFRGMLQAFVQNISSVSRRMLQSFLIWCCICVTICCNSMFLMFQLFQSYIAANGFYVASILFGCFTHMLQLASACFKCFICF